MATLTHFGTCGRFWLIKPPRGVWAKLAWDRCSRSLNSKFGFENDNTLEQNGRMAFNLPFFEIRTKDDTLADEPRCKLQMSVSSTPNAHFWCLPFLDDHFVDVESPFSGSRFPKPQYPLQNSLGWKVCASKNARRMVPDNVFVRKKCAFTRNSWIAQILDGVGYRIPHATEKAGQPSRHHPVWFSTLTC